MPTLLVMPYRLILLAVALVVAGCGDTVAEKTRLSRQKREESAQLLLSKTPQPQVYYLDGNELKVIEVPVRDSTGNVDVQRCFLWRDQEFKTSTLSCGQMPEVLLVN